MSFDYTGSFSGSFTGNLTSTNGVISSSAQVNYVDLQNKPITISSFQKNVIIANSNFREVTFPSYSQSISTELTFLESSVNTLTGQVQAAVSGTVPPGTISGSDQITINISGSTPLGFQFDKLFNRLQFDSSTGLNVSESAEGTAFISIGSHFSDIIVNGQLTLFATGSQSLEIIAGGGIEIFTFPALTGNNTSSIQELEFRLDTSSQHFIDAVNSIAGGIGGINLQQTTDLGSVTTNAITASAFSGSIIVLSNQSQTPQAIEGGIFYSSSNFYFGISENT